MIVLIPKIIHYCWFGKGPKNKLIEKCINSWLKFCPDYQIIEWNEDNIDISDCTYAQEALANNKWAFLSDYVRYKVIYEHGGIYLDTDVELIRNPDQLLTNSCYFGFENNSQINSGIGFGAEPGHTVIKEICDVYKSMKLFMEDGSINRDIVTVVTTKVLLKHGLKEDNTLQHLSDITIYPTEYFAPKNYNSFKAIITKNTYSIHQYAASWQTKKQQSKHKKEVLKDFIIHMPNRIILSVLGEKKYNKLKKLIKRG